MRSCAQNLLLPMPKSQWSNGMRGLCSDLQTVHATLGKDKEEVEKVEHEKAQWFRNLLHKKVACLRNGMEKLVATLSGQCLEFPAANATVVPCLIGSEQQCRCCPPCSLNLARTLPAMWWLVF
jgi:hypothetical protein